MRSVGCILALMLVWQPLAQAESPEVKKALAPVARAYHKLELDRALELVKRAQGLAKTDADRALCSLYEGVVDAAMGHADDSNAAFRAALALQPDAKLPLKVSMALTNTFESLRKEAEEQRAQAQTPKAPEPAPEPALAPAAPPPPAPAPAAALSPDAIRIAAPELQLVNLSPDLGALYAEHFSQHLSSSGVSVITSKKISALLGLERQRQLMGCTDASCFVELANALGADGIVTGSIGRVGTLYQININIISSRDGATLSARSVQASSDEAVLATLSRVGEEMARELKDKLHPVVAVGGKVRRLSWIPAVAGVGAAVGGVVLLSAAASTSQQLTGTSSSAPATLTLLQGRQLVQQGQNQQTWGWVCVGGATALVAAGAGMFLFGGPVEVRATAAPGGAGMAVSGAF